MACAPILSLCLIGSVLIISFWNKNYVDQVPKIVLERFQMHLVAEIVDSSLLLPLIRGGFEAIRSGKF